MPAAGVVGGEGCTPCGLGQAPSHPTCHSLPCGLARDDIKCCGCAQCCSFFHVECWTLSVSTISSVVTDRQHITRVDWNSSESTALHGLQFPSGRSLQLETWPALFSLHRSTCPGPQQSPAPSNHPGKAPGTWGRLPRTTPPATYHSVSAQ